MAFAERPKSPKVRPYRSEPELMPAFTSSKGSEGSKSSSPVERPKLSTTILAPVGAGAYTRGVSS